MTIRALADSKFIRRYLLIACGGLAFMLWGLYDCLIAKPKALKMAEAYAALADLDSTELSKQWGKITEENGWPRAKPEAPEIVRQSIWFNWFVAIAGLILCLFFLLKYLRTKTAWMEATDTGIHTSWGQSLEFGQIRKINKAKWEKKGIARVLYENTEGHQKTMVFDDFKFDRATISQLMSLAENGLNRDQIIGGKTETEIALDRADQEKKKSAEAEELEDDQ